MKFWLIKSEPKSYSIEELKKDKKALWDGVRNYQARNFMVHQMEVGDPILFYHSSCKPPGIVGLAEVSKKAEPDPTCFDKKSPYYDPKSSFERPRWFCVEICHKKTFSKALTLEEIKAHPRLSTMLVIKKGMRLSIQPVLKKDYDYIVSLCF